MGEFIEYRDRIEALIDNLPDEDHKETEVLGARDGVHFLYCMVEEYHTRTNDPRIEFGSQVLNGQVYKTVNSNLQHIPQFVYTWFGMTFDKLVQIPRDHYLITELERVPTWGGYPLQELWERLSVEEFGELLRDNPCGSIWHPCGPFCEDDCKWQTTASQS